jgi:trimeric autotransporter adhesin
VKRPIALIVTIAALLAAGPAAAADPTPTPTWVPDGEVHAVAVSGSTAYVGGEFGSIAPYTGGSLSFDPQTGQRRASWPDVVGSVAAAVRDGSGGWYVGGSFQHIGGVARRNLAHVRADGSVDPAWAPTADGGVRTLVEHGGIVYIGGFFHNVNGQPHQALAAVESATGASVDFLAVGAASTVVHAVAVGGDSAHPVLYVGGFFDTIGGKTRHSLAAISLDDNKLTPFDPNIAGGVTAIGLKNGVYAGGLFETVNGNVERNGLASFDPVSGTASAWNPHIANVGAFVAAIDIAADTVYVVGRLGTVNSNTTPKVRSKGAAFDATSGVATSWDPQIAAPYGSIATSVKVAGTAVYVGGDFTSAGGQERSNFTAVSKDTGSPLAGDPLPRGFVSAIAGDEHELIIGGSFWSAGGVSRDNIAAIDLPTGEPTRFDAGVRGPVYALAVGDTGVWAGGDFTKVNGNQPRNYLANLDPATGQARSFSQDLNRPVHAIALEGSSVYAGGEFLTVGNSIRQHLAAFRDVPGFAGELLPFDPDPNANVSALAVKGGNVYLGGDFTTLSAGADPRRHLASVDSFTGVPTKWDPSPNDLVYALAPVGNDIVAAGQFSTVNGTTPRPGAAAFDAVTGAVTGWDAHFDGLVAAVATDGSQTFAGGEFTHAGGQERHSLGAFDPVSGAATGWDPGLTPNQLPVEAIAATPHGWLVAGGNLAIDHGPVRTSQLAVYRLPAPDTAGGGTGGAGGGGGGGGGGAGGSARDRTAPVLSALKASKKRFRVGKLPRRGTRVSFRLSEAASVRFEAFVVKRRHRTRKGRFAQLSPAGASRVAFTGRLGKRTLKPGRYVVRLTPTDRAGNVGAARSVTLRVVA